MADVGDAAPSPPPAPTLPDGEYGVLVLTASHRVTTVQPDELTVVILSPGHRAAILSP